MVIGRPGDVERKKVGEQGALEDIGAGGTEKKKEEEVVVDIKKDNNKKLGKEDMYVAVRLKSGEVRKIHRDACATIGTASNSNYNRRQLGKAGRSRWLGIRPSVRGVAMNASDHPHGGGRGKSKGNVQPVSIWGQLTKGGYKTRKKRNVNRAVIQARPRSIDQKSKPKRKEKSRSKSKN
ncbi:MAG: hypothetical protein Q9210_004153 [Variospora velana]